VSQHRDIEQANDCKFECGYASQCSQTTENQNRNNSAALPPIFIQRKMVSGFVGTQRRSLVRNCRNASWRATVPRGNVGLEEQRRASKLDAMPSSAAMMPNSTAM
jgi:hypothetical protein